MKTYLSIDIGTSAAKLSLFDDAGRLIAAQSAAYPVEYPRPDWAEQDPLEWWRAVCQMGPVVMQACAQHPLAGIAVSGQTPLCVPVDRTGQPLRKAILWLDRRATPQVEWLREQIGENRCRSVSTNRLDSYFGGAKWLWYKQAEPHLFARTWKILQASSFVIYHLTGQTVLDPAQAGLCSPCFNTTLQNWDADLCRDMGLPVDLLPEIHPAWAVIGAVSAAAANATGLPQGTPVVCGGGDFACACLGAGVTGQSRQGALMLGTAGNLLFPGLENHDPLMLHTIHLTGQPLPFGGVMAGGNLSWFANLLGVDDPALFARLDAEAAQIPPGSEGLVFLPYLMGERTPIWDPAARGAFVGLSSRHGRAHLYRAILEGIALAFRQIADLAAGDHSPAHAPAFNSIIAIDGGARSALWRSILAAAIGVPIIEGSARSGTALGSAFLAALGTGAVSSFADISTWVETSRPTPPDPIAADRYAEIYPVYAGLYAKLKSDFEVLNRVSAGE